MGNTAPKVQYATPYGAYGPKVGQIPNPATRPAAYAPAATYGEPNAPSYGPSFSSGMYGAPAAPYPAVYGGFESFAPAPGYGSAPQYYGAPAPQLYAGY
eukprot:TRINITY_DN5794_c0_g1_i1.p3 TRINITY_DN5794_c0_g1~~TRINITY_DN5794_c0_g1_i1.p3  ORF type:complete len:107 (-),score=1.50 TRINITY_DN5794_c0_g1_i1:223-519(-)